MSGYLDVQCSTFNLRGTLLDDEGNAVFAVLRCLSKVDPKQMQPPLKLFMATLNCKCLQTFLMASQRALERDKRELQTKTDD